METLIGKLVSAIFLKRRKRKDTRELWMRVGITFYGTPEEINKLIEGGDNEIIKGMLRKGKWFFDGDCYCPEEIIEEYNRRYGTNHDPNLCEYCV